MRYETRDKAAHFSVSSPSHFVAERRRISPFSFSRAASPRSLTSSEVLFCAEILTFARTHFEKGQ